MERGQKHERSLEPQKQAEKEEFGPWMVVERRQRRNHHTLERKSGEMTGGTVRGSRFGVLSDNHKESTGNLESKNMSTFTDLSKSGNKLKINRRGLLSKTKRKGVLLDKK